MTELPTAFRAALAEAFEMPRLKIASRQKSTDGTEKFLFRLHDGQPIETVAIPEGDRLTFCVSSQAGCALALRLLRDGPDGLRAQPRGVRDRRSGARARAARSSVIATNIVFMGMGEPL